MITGMGNTLDIYAQIGLFLLVGMASKNMNVCFWHKVDTQLTNNSFQCWWAGTPSIGHAPSLV